MINYSYINSVFPNYENSSSYNLKMFNSLNTLKETNINAIPVNTDSKIKSTLKTSSDKFSLDEEIGSLKRTPDKFYLDEDLHYGNGIPKINIMSTKTPTPAPARSPVIKPVAVIKPTATLDNEFTNDKIKDLRFYSNYDNQFKSGHGVYDNLSFYNEPIIKQTQKPEIKQTIQYQPTPDSIDSIAMIETFNSDCNNHIMSCNKCKELYDRHYKLNNNTNHGEIWDILSYIIFAIVIIFLLDKF